MLTYLADKDVQCIAIAETGTNRDFPIINVTNVNYTDLCLPVITKNARVFGQQKPAVCSTVHNCFNQHVNWRYFPYNRIIIKGFDKCDHTPLIKIEYRHLHDSIGHLIRAQKEPAFTILYPSREKDITVTRPRSGKIYGTCILPHTIVDIWLRPSSKGHGLIHAVISVMCLYDKKNADDRMNEHIQAAKVIPGELKYEDDDMLIMYWPYGNVSRLGAAPCMNFISLRPNVLQRFSNQLYLSIDDMILSFYQDFFNSEFNLDHRQLEFLLAPGSSWQSKKMIEHKAMIRRGLTHGLSED